MAGSTGVSSQALYTSHFFKRSALACSPSSIFMENLEYCVNSQKYSCRWGDRYKTTEWCRMLAVSVRVQFIVA